MQKNPIYDDWTSEGDEEEEAGKQPEKTGEQLREEEKAKHQKKLDRDIRKLDRDITKRQSDLKNLAEKEKFYLEEIKKLRFEYEKTKEAIIKEGFEIGLYDKVNRQFAH